MDISVKPKGDYVVNPCEKCDKEKSVFCTLACDYRILMELTKEL